MWMPPLQAPSGNSIPLSRACRPSSSTTSKRTTLVRIAGMRGVGVRGIGHNGGGACWRSSLICPGVGFVPRAVPESIRSFPPTQ